MTNDNGQRRPTPVWLWVLFGFAIAVLLAGGLVSRVEHMLIGIPLYAVGLGILITFVVLRGKFTGRK